MGRGKKKRGKKEFTLDNVHFRRGFLPSLSLSLSVDRLARLGESPLLFSALLHLSLKEWKVLPALLRLRRFPWYAFEKKKKKDEERCRQRNANEEVDNLLSFSFALLFRHAFVSRFLELRCREQLVLATRATEKITESSSWNEERDICSLCFN